LIPEAYGKSGDASLRQFEEGGEFPQAVIATVSSVRLAKEHVLRKSMPFFAFDLAGHIGFSTGTTQRFWRSEGAGPRQRGCRKNWRLVDRFDPSQDLGFMQDAMVLQELTDCKDGAMDERVRHRRAEKGGFEPLRFGKIVGPFAARRGKSKIGARRQGPG
jgi:hypothetical protein